MVAFARCMREHGIDMPDPTGEGGLVMRKDDDHGPDPDSEQFQQAEQACDHHLATLGRGKAGSGAGRERPGAPAAGRGRRRRGGAGRGGLVDEARAGGEGGGQATGGEVATTTAAVTRRDLRAQEEVDGTLGYGRPGWWPTSARAPSPCPPRG